eukprot:CAMPEP_0177720652 /NCGR_PEP_ID=MMETSP0484_2-20121128/16731_1 /TAXON_ID=354590 /ORGANISM="Rhodomonas lens, Strain RHODO" /LENGTH=426 /DNA_ID=CAMNT_0019232911 /DNA_START=27 /DNA_END=1308 /DNA_ORIENTATION=-
MKFVTGDETGLIKVSGVEKKELLGKMGVQSRTEGIECMEWVPGTEGHVVVGKTNGIVQRWDAYNQTLAASWDPLTVAHEKPRSVFFMQPPTSPPLMLTCCENGAVAIRKMDDAMMTITDEEDITVAGPVSRMKASPSHTKLGYGGKENELQLYDFETRKVEWKARNVPCNKLDLRLPVWVTDLQWIDREDDRKIAICTAYGQVRVYDVRAQRRPVMDTKISEDSEQIRLMDGTRLTCLDVHSSGTWAAVGDALGGLTKVDLRTGNIFGKFKNISGSVRAVQFHRTENVLACASLDRFVRVYELRTMKMINQVYLKQRLNTLLFDVEPSTAEPEKEMKKRGKPVGSGKGEEEEEDDMDPFDAMHGMEQDDEDEGSKEEEEGEEEAGKEKGISRKGTVNKKRKTEKTAKSVKGKKAGAGKAGGKKKKK